MSEKTVEELVIEKILEVTWGDQGSVTMSSNFIHDLLMEGLDSDELVMLVEEQLNKDLGFRSKDDGFMIDKYKTVGEFVEYVKTQMK